MIYLERDIEITILLDFYGEILPKNQKEMAKLYFCNDLSLSEISEEFGISRQGVRDAVKRAEETLLKTEEKLKLYAKYRDNLKDFLVIEKLSSEIFCLSGVEEVRRKAKKINQIIRRIGSE